METARLLSYYGKESLLETVNSEKGPQETLDEIWRSISPRMDTDGIDI